MEVPLHCKSSQKYEPDAPRIEVDVPMETSINVNIPEQRPLLQEQIRSMNFARMRKDTMVGGRLSLVKLLLFMMICTTLAYQLLIVPSTGVEKGSVLNDINKLFEKYSEHTHMIYALAHALEFLGTITLCNLLRHRWYGVQSLWFLFVEMCNSAMNRTSWNDIQESHEIQGDG